MATETQRAMTSDPFNNARFFVTDSGGFLKRDTIVEAVAGFNTCTMPEMSQAHVEYQEGIWTYKRKFPGDVTFNTVTLTKGVMLREYSFYKWMKAAAENRAYRTKLSIWQFHRDDIKGAKVFDFRNAKPSRIIHLHQALPGRNKIGSDLDATSHEISIEEMDVEYEWFEIEGVRL